MLKMGLHRDPSKLPRITPYQGEMRRRLWHIAIQIDLLVSFHLGLPGMINGIESDTALPSNLLDSDFDEDSTQLPSSRPSTEYTSLTYVINKSKLVRVFGLVARLSHSLTVPMYDEVMRIDACLREVWSEVPIFMKVKPLSESITDAPTLVIQRFGLASLFQKSRCVLHRRYIADPNPLKEHDYSRRTCLEAAVTMLDYQRTIFEATKPGAILSQNRWFLASLVINDYLLADMVVALALQQLSKVDCLDWMTACSPPLTKASLIGLLRGSYSIWIQMLGTLTDCRKAVNVVRKMILRIQTQLDITILDSESESESESPYDNRRTESSAGDEHTSPISNISAYAVSLIQGRNGNSRSHDMGSSVNDTINLDTAKLGLGSVEGVAMQQDMTEVWPLPEPQGGYDWDQFDAMTRGPTDSGTIIPQIPDQNWMDESGYSGFDDFPTINSWSSFRSN
ncbi:hypothetical protein GGR50DRAFT_300649 [Xylaria sp. CBS 124048]|nr:hypothetical protein GGR50DRAFT_300649 [Xylaria sp. CBS 124048]